MTQRRDRTPKPQQPVRRLSACEDAPVSITAGTHVRCRAAEQSAVSIDRQITACERQVAKRGLKLSLLPLAKDRA